MLMNTLENYSSKKVFETMVETAASSFKNRLLNNDLV
jgi:hypothetical protein